MDVGSCVGVDSQMMDMIRVIGRWPRVYTKNKSKADVRSRSQENVDGGCGDGEQNLEKEFEFSQAALRSHGDIFAARLIPPPSAPHFPLRHE